MKRLMLVYYDYPIIRNEIIIQVVISRGGADNVRP